MPEYIVRWEINIDAADPIEAAGKALDIQRDATSEATWFEVQDSSGGAPVSLDASAFPLTTPVEEPEIWDPNLTPRTLTLFQDAEDAPTLMAMCAPRLDGGFYVPILTLPYLAYYWGQCAANDPNGEWGHTIPHYKGHETGDIHDVRLVIPGSDGDTEMLYLPIAGTHHEGQTIANTGAKFEVDRLPWQDGEQKR